MSQSLKIRPSEVVGLYRDDDPVSFWFDRAVHRFGQMVEADITEYTRRCKTAEDGQAKGHQRLMEWLDFDGTMANQRFAKPRNVKKRTVPRG